MHVNNLSKYNLLYVMITLVYLEQKWHTHTASVELKPATLTGGCMDSVLRSVQGRADASGLCAVLLLWL